jgi:sugar lactone lactonase YvrE
VSPILGLDRASIFFNGIFTDPQLNHPEGVAIGRDGSVWCGGERGEIFRIEPDGSSMEIVASNGGFILGIAFDPAGNLYACDIKHQTLFRLDGASHAFEPFARLPEGRRMVTPNFVVVDAPRNSLYVSDSYVARQPGPGIWRLDLQSGEGDLWYESPLNFANGMCLSPDGDRLYVVESWAYRVVVFPIREDGGPGEPTTVVQDPTAVFDGLAVDAGGNLYIACYTPARIMRVRTNGTVEVLIEDPEHDVMRYPTNCAFRGTDLFTANLGGWAITRIDAGIPGHVLV